MTRYHFTGIGGAGMSSLARYTLEQGHEVSGTDLRESPKVDALRALGASIALGHDPEHVSGVDVVVASGAIPDDNIELVAAREASIPVLHRGELLARFTHEHPESVVVCGTHGKGTTAGALIAMLEAAGRKTSYVLGAPRKDTGRAAHYVDGADVLVVEVDESDKSHLHHHPRHLLICNLELDHLYTYPTLDALVSAFSELLCTHFLRSAPGACVLGCYGAGMEALREIAQNAGVAHVTCGEVGDVVSRGVRLNADGAVSLTLVREGRELARLESPLKGTLNGRNVLAAATMALELDVSSDAIAAGARAFSGLIDRFDEASVGGRLCITDYTSHPTSIAGNLEALRARVTGSVHAVFQPFRVSLLSHYWQAYIASLSRADRVHLIPLDTAGEVPRSGVTSEALAAQMGAEQAQVHADLQDLEASLEADVQPGDAVIVFGGGPLFALARRLTTRWGG